MLLACRPSARGGAVWSMETVLSPLVTLSEAPGATGPLRPPDGETTETPTGCEVHRSIARRPFIAEDCARVSGISTSPSSDQPPAWRSVSPSLPAATTSTRPGSSGGKSASRASSVLVVPS